ncbi:dolichyl-phosphate-mannose--protein mannosyltransferase [Corynebacterium gerontici]|nr:phospholipid carrier-dependent glycosyltransferase [Corynebacterium gerontici]
MLAKERLHTRSRTGAPQRYVPRFSTQAGHLAPGSKPWTRADSISTAIISSLAILTRFIRLGAITDEGTPVFDEKHYVPQAFDILESTSNPLVGGIELNPGFGLVVHPPLAKQLIALGEFLFGYSPWGWRVINACIGVGVVLLIMAITRRLSNSTFAASIAGVIAVCDGVLLVTSRFGMLDIIQVFFVLCAAYCFLRDAQQQDAAYSNAYASRANIPTLGFRIGFRWWRFACGISLGLSLSVKWSGLYYMAFFGMLAVALDAFRRHRGQAKRPILGAIGLDAFPAFASLVLLPVAVYLLSWRSWFDSETSVYRHALSDGTIAADSFLQRLPEAIAGFVYYHTSVLQFHSTLTNANGHHHPWESKPLSWLVAGRPVLYYSNTDVACAAGKCQQMLFLFGTPAIWWMTIPVLLWAAYSLIVRRQVQYLLPFVAFMAGFVPWLLNYDRQMYFFYAAVLVPFTIVLLALSCHEAANASTGWLSRGRRYRLMPRCLALCSNGQRLVLCYLSLVVAAFVYFLPILYGILIPGTWYSQLMWLPSWY